MIDVQFRREVSRVLGLPYTETDSDSEDSSLNTRQWALSGEMESCELSEALGALDWKERNDLVRQYAAFREELQNLVAERGKQCADHEEKHREWRWGDKKGDPPVLAPCRRLDMAAYEALFARLPKEFALYARGAAAYRSEAWDDAIAQWTELLALPPGDRRFRTVWAAYMNGMASWRKEDFPEAEKWFAQTRQHVKDGFKDSQDMGNGSLGWSGRALLDQGRFAEAINRYVEYAQIADYQESGLVSLDMVCAQAGRSKTDLAVLAEDPVARDVYTVWVVSHSRMASSRKEWLDAIRTLPADVETLEPYRLARIAYDSGEFDQAAAWLDRVEPPTPDGQWLRAKLLAREGKLAEATEVLHALDESLKPTDERRIRDRGDPWLTISEGDMMRAERGVLLLQQQQYAGALEEFLRAEFFPDALYIAERVLTMPELEQFIQTHAEDPAFTTPRKRNGEDCFLDAYSYGPCTTPMALLRYVLAMRLARNGEWAKAAPLYPATPDAWALRRSFRTPPPDDYSGKAIRIGQLLQRGRDTSQPVRERAQNLLEAGKMMRQYGLELTGTFLEPDWAIVGANLDWPEVARIGHKNAEFGPSQDELDRYQQHTPRVDKRFHYRYVAADVMWECAELMPGNDVLGAEALYLGGTFLKRRDPEAADRFYKALVQRHPNLLIAQQADKLRWFPKEFTDELAYSPRNPQ